MLSLLLLLPIQSWYHSFRLSVNQLCTPQCNETHTLEDASTGMSWSSKWHDDVIKWKHFPRYWPFVRGIHRSPVNSPHKGQWRGALMFSLSCAWINSWVNNCEAGDLRRHRVHYDVTVMKICSSFVGISMKYSAWNNILYTHTNSYASPVPDVWSSSSACGYRHVLWLSNVLNI